MKTILNFLIDNLIFVIVILLVAYCTVNLCFSKPKSENYHAYYYSYENGCYSAYEDICPRFNDDFAISNCYHRGLDFCEHAAKRFANWVERVGNE